MTNSLNILVKCCDNYDFSTLVPLFFPFPGFILFLFRNNTNISPRFLVFKFVDCDPSLADECYSFVLKFQEPISVFFHVIKKIARIYRIRKCRNEGRHTFFVPIKLARGGNNMRFSITVNRKNYREKR